MTRRVLLAMFGAILFSEPFGSVCSEEFLYSRACRIAGMSVVRGRVVFGADANWFDPGDWSDVFHLESKGAAQLVRNGDGPQARNLAARADGALYWTEGTDRDANWAYLGLGSGIDEWKTAIVHNECTVAWQRTMPEKLFRFVYLAPSAEPLILRDKDGVERKVFPAVLVRGDRRRHLVTAVEPSKYSPSLAANDSYGLGNLCVVQGEVFFTLGQVPFGNFSRDNSAELWALDGNLIAVWMKDKWWFLSTDDEGYAILLEKPKLSSLWDVNPPKKETKEGSIRKEQDDRTSLSLAPSGDPVIRTDRNGNDFQLRRAKLQKEPHKVRIVRVSR